MRVASIATIAFVVVVLAATGSRAAGRPGNAVPILMYHVIADPPKNAPFPELYVDPGSFKAQIAWLHTHGFQAVTLRAVYNHWARGTRLPQHPVVITFDDGYRSNFTAAFPALKARRWPGVVNLKVKNMTVSWGLSPRRIRRLISAGWEIDAHTITHPDLTAASGVELRREIAGARSRIQRQFGVPVDFFCYPAGRYNATVIAEVRRAGYLGATTTDHGLARPTELYTLRRVRVSRSDGVAELAQKLTDLGVGRA